MDSERKSAIFEKYDFSKTALLKRAGVASDDFRSELYHDIAGMVQSLLINVSAIANGEAGDVESFIKFQDMILKSYGWLQSKYQAVDWSELDSGDPDFNVFFRIMALIDGLGQSIDAFLNKSRRELGRRMDSSPYYLNIKEEIQEIGDLMQEYLNIRERLEEQLAL